jgi:hypothetical protein
MKDTRRKIVELLFVFIGIPTVIASIWIILEYLIP